MITSEVLAKGYGTSSIRIQQNHTRNEHGFEEGKLVFKATGEELKSIRLSFCVFWRS
ncbi:hypothetical protein PUG81_28635 [Erwiniaceae bacterium L1_54_6]|nr:hypothetical protein [Erwiniaceae bacterium L1_54_6]